MPTPIARASVPDLVFAELCQAILSGQYAAGERMPTQRRLAAELAVNMASVREALGRLEQLRLIEVRHGDATRVLDWRNSGGLEALAVLGSTDRDTMADLFEARRLLLVQSARLACERRRPEQVDQLRELAGVIQSAEEDSVALLADWSYMATLVQAAGNLILQLIMNSVRELYLPSMEKFTAVVSERARLAPLYERAARAIAERNADAAAEAIASLSAAQEASMLRGS